MSKTKYLDFLEQPRDDDQDEKTITIESIIKEDVERKAAEMMAATEERARKKVLNDQAAAERTEKIVMIEVSRKETDEELDAITNELNAILADTLRSLAADAEEYIESEKEVNERAIRAEEAARIIGIPDRITATTRRAASLAKGAAAIASDPVLLEGARRFLSRA